MTAVIGRGTYTYALASPTTLTFCLRLQSKVWVSCPAALAVPAGQPVLSRRKLDGQVRLMISL
jgi:hypothetical protein